MAAPSTYLQKVDFSNTGKSGGITYTYIQRVYEVSYDILTNTSKMYLMSILKSNYSGACFSQWGTGVKASVDGKQVYNEYKQRECSGTKEHIYYECEYTVTHNDDGKKTITIDSEIWQDNAQYFPNAGIKISGKTMELTTIPRASSFGTVTGNTLGSEITINIDRKSNSFTHSLWYSFGSKTWQGIASSVGTSQKFTPPSSLCSEIPNATSGQMTLILRTYNGDKQVGSDVYKTITVNVPSSVVPTIGGITVTENVSDIASKAGVYIQGLSKLNLAIANASGIYGSTIKSYKITFEGFTYTSQSAVTGYIKGSGNLVITAEITDSRGRKGSRNMTIAVVAYSPPKFNGTPTAARQSDATNVLVTASGSVSSIKNGTTEKNDLKLYVLYKTASTSSFPGVSDTYKVEIPDTSALSFSEITKTLSNISATSSYDIRALIQDNFKQTYWDLELGTEIVIGDINRAGWAIGKYHERGMLDVAGDIYMNDKLVAYAEHEHRQYLTELPSHSHDQYAVNDHTHNYAPSEHTHDYVPTSQLKYDTIVNTNSEATSASWKDRDYNFLIGMFKIGSNTSITEKVIIPVNHTFLVSDNTNEDKYVITLSETTKTLSRSSGSGTIFALYGVKVV